MGWKRAIAGALTALALVAGAGAVDAAAPSQSREVSYAARLTNGLARLGETVGIVVEVENADSASVLRLPEVDGLEIGPIPAPSRNVSSGVVRGRRYLVESKTWVIPVRPSREGEFDIPGVEVGIDGKKVLTDGFSLRVVQDLEGQELGLFEVDVSATEVVEGQPVTIDMLIGWDRGVDGRVSHANLILSWWGKVPGLLELDEPEVEFGTRPVKIALNDRDRIDVHEIGTVTRDDRQFRAFRLRRVFLPTRPGEIELSRGVLQFGRAEERDLFGRRRTQGEFFYVPGEDIFLSVAELPEEGRPFDYTGAIGSLSARAVVDTRDVDVGDSIKVEVTWSGEGNLEFFEPPDLSRDDAFDGFRVFGSTSREKGLDRRTEVFDIAPETDEVAEIPSIRLPIYDPGEARYTEVATEPIPIRVRPLEDAVTLEAEGAGDGLADDVDDIRTEPIRAAGTELVHTPGPGLPVLIGTGVLLPLAWLGVRTAVRRRRGDPDAPLERRRSRARRVLARELERAAEPADELRALQRFLAARSREGDWAWVGRDVSRHLEPAGVAPEDVDELADVIGQLERATYGARDDAPDKSEILSLADRLVRVGL